MGNTNSAKIDPNYLQTKNKNNYLHATFSHFHRIPIPKTTNKQGGALRHELKFIYIEKKYKVCGKLELPYTNDILQKDINQLFGLVVTEPTKYCTKNFYLLQDLTKFKNYSSPCPFFIKQIGKTFWIDEENLKKNY